MYGDALLLQALLPVLSKSVGKTWAAPPRLMYSRLAAATPLLLYWVCTAFIGFGPTVESLLPTNMKIFWPATLVLGSIDVPDQLFRSDCMVDSMAALIVALYMHAV